MNWENYKYLLESHSFGFPSVATMYFGSILMRSLQVMCMEFLHKILAPEASKPGKLPYWANGRPKENYSWVALWIPAETTAKTINIEEGWLMFCWQVVLPTLLSPTE